MTSKNTKRYFLIFFFFSLVFSSIFFTFPENSQAATINKPPYLLALSSGLVGHWTLDGKNVPWTSATAATALDSSGNSNTGTLTSMAQATSPIAGKIGQALKFDGSNDYIDAGHLTTLESGDVSFAFWIKPEAVSGVKMILQQYDSTPSRGWIIYSSGQEIEFQSGGSDLVSGGGSSGFFQIGVWSHVVATNSGGTFRIYKNGVLFAGPAVKTVTDNATASNFTIGGPTEAGVSPFNGSLDDVRVYNRALSATEITQLYNFGAAKQNLTITPTALTSGLVGHWTLDGKNVPWTSATAATALDSSGNSNTGTLTSMAQATSPVAGKIGQGLNFDGTDDRIATASDFIGTSAGTYSAWIYARSEGESSLGFIITNGGAVQFGLGLCSTRTIGFTSNNSTNDACSATASITYNTWYFVAATRTSSGTASLYINGVLSGTANQNSGTPQAGSTNVNIGNSSFSSRSWDGYLDDVRIYNRVLSAAEITQLYNLGR